MYIYMLPGTLHVSDIISDHSFLRVKKHTCIQVRHGMVWCGCMKFVALDGFCVWLGKHNLIQQFLRNQSDGVVFE